jgi:hypothetical protein
MLTTLERIRLLIIDDGSEGPSVRKRTVRNVNMARIRAIRGPIGYFRPAEGRRLRAIIAYNGHWLASRRGERHIARNKLEV